MPARKPGKLPGATISAEYALEYGIDALEVHADALADGARVLVHDDLLATGGTAGALCDLVAGLGAQIVGCAFLVELTFLQGRRRLAPHNVYSLIEFVGVDGADRWPPRIAPARLRPPNWRSGSSSPTPTTCPRWWPGVERVEGVEDDRFTQVFKTKRGRPVRADFRVLDSQPPWRARLGAGDSGHPV